MSAGGSKKKIWLSLRVGKVNASLGKEALVEGMALPACVKNVEDHGYSLTFGIKVRFCPSDSPPGGGSYPSYGSDALHESSAFLRLQTQSREDRSYVDLESISTFD